MSKDKWVKKRLKEVVQEEYTPIEGLDSVAKKVGIDVKDLIRLDANENLFLPKTLMSRILREIADEVDVRTYPRLEEKRLVEALADYLRLPSDYIVVSNGSDPLIESIVKTLLKDTEGVISVSPTFAMYKVITTNQGCDYVDVPLNEDFSLDVDALLSEVRPNTVLCFLSSPNNPTGNQFERGYVRRIIEEFNGFVVIDEAYEDFALYSVVDMIGEFENLIVLRTFSKAFGLAGLRIGYSLANSDVSKALRGIQLPFNVNKVSLVMARRVLEQRDMVEDVVQRVKSERDKLFKSMGNISGVRAFKSDTNFIFFKTEEDPEKVYYGLQNRGILIRRFKSILGRGDFLRVTVGLPEMNGKFVEALKEVCGE